MVRNKGNKTHIGLVM